MILLNNRTADHLRYNAVFPVFSVIRKILEQYIDIYKKNQENIIVESEDLPASGRQSFRIRNK